MWTFEAGLAWCCQANRLLLDHNVHTALTGSVLFKGSSKKDLDIIIYPHKTSCRIPFINEICNILSLRFVEDRTNAHSRYSDSDHKKVYHTETESGKRIDIFMLQ
jgi:hypothetical protein